MTLTDAEKTAVMADESDPHVVDDGPPPFIARYTRRTMVTWVALGLIVIALAFFLVEDPIAHVWFDSRQKSLGAQTGLQGQIPIGHQVGVLVIEIPAVPGSSQGPTVQRLYVTQGDGTSQLRGGPGHAPASALLGARGNSVIFGHRKHWGAPFASLSSVVKGGQVDAQSVNGTTAVVYTVTSVKTVPAGDTAVLRASKDFRLTLVTAAGAGRWLVVTALSGAAERPLAGASAAGGPVVSSPVRNGAFYGLLLALVGLTFVVLALRKRVRAGTLWLMVSPLVAAVLLTLILELDLLYSPLA